jgi:UDP-N-acetylglucosamine 2-epimerase (non-hydrolysing)
MLGVVASVPSGRFDRGEAKGARVLHLALTRSAAVSLAPVAAAFRGHQAVVNGAGELTAWTEGPPPTIAAELPPAAAAQAVTRAIATSRPDVVLLAGDSDVALACALATTRGGIALARLGAGLRCGDRGDRREINRIAIDALSSRLYTDGDLADETLLGEGVARERVVRVGSTLVEAVQRWRELACAAAAWMSRGVAQGQYILVCLDRPGTFASRAQLSDALAALATRYPAVACPGEHALQPTPGVTPAGALDYVEYLSLLAGAGAVLTDSARVQEESTALGVACFTLATASERSMTLTHGTNTLLGDDPAAIARMTVEPAQSGSDRAWSVDAGKRIATDLQTAPWESA